MIRTDGAFWSFVLRKLGLSLGSFYGHHFHLLPIARIAQPAHSAMFRGMRHPAVYTRNRISSHNKQSSLVIKHPRNIPAAVSVQIIQDTKYPSAYRSVALVNSHSTSHSTPLTQTISLVSSS